MDPFGQQVGETGFQPVLIRIVRGMLQPTDDGGKFFFMPGHTVRGIILNHFHPGDIMEEDNLTMIEEITGVKVVATVQSGDEALDMNAEALAALYE